MLDDHRQPDPGRDPVGHRRVPPGQVRGEPDAAPFRSHEPGHRQPDRADRGAAAVSSRDHPGDRVLQRVLAARRGRPGGVDAPSPSASTTPARTRGAADVDTDGQHAPARRSTGMCCTSARIGCAGSGGAAGRPPVALWARATRSAAAARPRARRAAAGPRPFAPQRRRSPRTPGTTAQRPARAPAAAGCLRMASAGGRPARSRAGPAPQRPAPAAPRHQGLAAAPSAVRPSRRVLTRIHTAGSGRKPRQVLALQPGGGHRAAPEHRGQRHQPADPGDGDHQLVVHPGQLQRRRAGAGQQHASSNPESADRPVPAVRRTASSGGRRRPPAAGSSSPYSPAASASSAAPRSARPRRSSTAAAADRAAARRAPPPARRAGAQPPRRRARAEAGGAGSTWFATNPSTRSPCRASAVSVRRVSAATTRSGVSTSRMPCRGRASSAAQPGELVGQPAERVRGALPAPAASRPPPASPAISPRTARRCAGNSRSRYPDDGLGQRQQPQRLRGRAAVDHHDVPRAGLRGPPHRGQREQLLDPGQHGQLVRGQLVHPGPGQHRGQVLTQPGPRAVEQGPGVHVRGEQAAPRPRPARRPRSASSASPSECAGSVETASALRPDRRGARRSPRRGWSCRPHPCP